MRIEAIPNVTLADISRLDANRSYFLSSTTGRIKEASFFMKIKCALGICGARAKVGNLVEAVKATLLKDAGMSADEQLDNDIKVDINREANIKGQVLQNLASKFRLANSKSFVRREAEQMAREAAKMGTRFANMKARTNGEENGVKQIFDHAFKPLLQGQLPTYTDKNGHVCLDKTKFGEHLKDARTEVEELLGSIGGDTILEPPTIDRHYAYHIVKTLFNEDGTRNDKTVDDLKSPDEAFADKLFDLDNHLHCSGNSSVYSYVKENGDPVEYARKIRERCGGDEDAEDVVELGLRSICMTGENDLRTEEDVFARIDAIKRNFAEAREVAKDIPGFMAEFREAMLSLNGGALPEGTLRRMADAVSRADFSKIAKLNSFSCSGTILQAIDQLRYTAEVIADVSNYKEGVVETADYNAYRQIVEAMAVLKAGPAALARIKNAVNGKAYREAAVILSQREDEASSANLYHSRAVREVRTAFFEMERRVLEEVREIFQPHDRDPEPLDTDDVTVEDAFRSTSVGFDSMFKSHIEPLLRQCGVPQDEWEPAAANDAE